MNLVIKLNSSSRPSRDLKQKTNWISKPEKERNERRKERKNEITELRAKNKKITSETKKADKRKQDRLKGQREPKYNMKS